MTTTTTPRTTAAAPRHHEHWQSRKHRRLILSSPTDHHPTVVQFAEGHAASFQLKVADAITSFAGSMKFVYLHIVVFAAWMLFVEKSPWQTLTLIVSLEAIFLSTFVMIGQNRQSSFQQAKADHEFATQEKELDENTILTREIHRMTQELHELQTKAKGAGTA